MKASVSMSTMRRVLHRSLRAVAGVTLALGVAACGNGPPAPSGSAPGGACAGTAGGNLGTSKVTIAATDQLLFAPASQSAKVGEIVEWTNPGTVAHTVTFDAANASCLSDAQFNPGASWQVKFTQTGTFTYKCLIHQPGMNGSITIS